MARVKIESETAKTRLASLEGENRSIKEASEREAKLAQLSANQPALIANLKRFGTVTKNERGIVLTLPENLWASLRSESFAPNADAKLTSIADILVNNPDYNVVIESHTDNKGTPEELQSLTDLRAKAIADRVGTLGVSSSRVKATGMGASLPVAPNTTNASRAKNRRVQLILTPNI